MRQRCTNPNSRGYKHYGGRGIKVCTRWSDFHNFYSDLGKRPTASHSIDRIDPDGDYEPSNCRWATQQIQSVNQRTRSTNTSGYRGVYWAANMNKWKAGLKHDYKSICIGFFDSREEAAWMRDQWALQLFGDYAPTNFQYDAME